MEGYFKTVVGVVLGASFLTGFLPKNGAYRYVSVAAGLVVLCTVLYPMFSVLQTDAEESFFFSFDGIPLEIPKQNYLKTEFERTVQERLETYLLEETGETVSVKIDAETEEDGQISEISFCSILPYSKTLAAKTANYLGISEEKVGMLS